MRTTLDLPEDLVLEAMKVTCIKTKTQVIITALEEIIQKSKLSQIKAFKGKINLEMDLDALRDRQCR